ncbi:MAG: hypothetical protein D6712_16620 [Chloroflexi bacterium]|nr:MAG: hypothetical protein D6712_16620 [Chloroflexota bacterium]
MALTEILQAIKSGDKARARQLLQPYLERNDPDAHYLAALVAPNREQARHHLLKTVALKPDHELALRGLKQLGITPPTPEPSPETNNGGAVIEFVPRVGGNDINSIYPPPQPETDDTLFADEGLPDDTHLKPSFSAFDEEDGEEEEAWLDEVEDDLDDDDEDWDALFDDDDDEVEAELFSDESPTAQPDESEPEVTPLAASASDEATPTDEPVKDTPNAGEEVTTSSTGIPEFLPYDDPLPSSAMPNDDTVDLLLEAQEVLGAMAVAQPPANVIPSDPAPVQTAPASAYAPVRPPSKIEQQTIQQRDVQKRLSAISHVFVQHGWCIESRTPIAAHYRREAGLSRPLAYVLAYAIPYVGPVILLLWSRLTKMHQVAVAILPDNSIGVAGTLGDCIAASAAELTSLARALKPVRRQEAVKIAFQGIGLWALITILWLVVSTYLL